MFMRAIRGTKFLTNTEVQTIINKRFGYNHCVCNNFFFFLIFQSLLIIDPRYQKLFKKKKKKLLFFGMSW